MMLSSRASVARWHAHGATTLARPARTSLRRAAVAPRAALRSEPLDVEEAKRLLDQAGYRFVDLRSPRDYDREHLTKPPRMALNVPWGEGGADFVRRLASACPATGTKMLVVCEDGGAASREAVELLASAGYTEAVRVEGGYSAWTKVFTTSGRRRPPPGRWVSSGKEALKSGLNIPGVAESYDEGGNLITARYAKGLKPGQEL